MTIRFKVIGNHAVTPPDKARPVAPGAAGSTRSVAWCERMERAGHIRRTDGGSTVYPTPKVKDTDDDSD